MKKIIFIAITIINGTNTYAQKIEQGTKMIGLNADLSEGIELGDIKQRVKFVPSFQIFVADNFSITGEVTLGFVKKKEKDNYGREFSRLNSNYEFMVGVRQYFGSKKLKPFIYGSIGVGREINSFGIKLEDGSAGWNHTTKYSYFAAKAGLGTLYSLNRFVNIETSVGLSYRNGIMEFLDTDTNSNIANGIQHNTSSRWSNAIQPTAKIGVQIKFPVKKKD